jgi:hypothetical protein
MTTSAFDPANDDLIIAKPRKEIVFIEDNVADYQAIAANAGAGRQVVILDSSKDGLQQIADALKGMSGIDALHIVTHGSEGKIGLGALTLDQASAAQHQDVLATIGASLAAGGDMLFYGCSVGAGQGAGLLNQLAIATGADVAASNDPTGDASLGGDWNLELASGNIEAAPFVDAALAAQYHALLNITGPVTLDFETLPNSAGGTPNDDIDYTLPGQPGYTLKFNGKSDAVWSYSAYSNTYLSFSPSSMEDKVTIAFADGQQFTPTSIKVNGNASSNQTLLFTGLRADNSEVMHASVDVIAGASINDFITKTLSGFTNITTLVITAQGGGIIQYFQMDDLVMSNIQQAAPRVSFVTSTTANGAYKAGDPIDISVAFDSAVDVTGTPQLKLETGATDRVVNYVSGSGTSTLTFRYTVQAGDTSADLDYFGTGALSLNGGTIKLHGDTTNADLTLPSPGTIGSLGSNKAIEIDTTPPAAPSTPDLDANYDKGVSSTDNLTNLTALKFTGTAGAGVTTVKLYDTDGTTEIGSATVSSGTYNITTTGTLSDGAHTITAKAFDAAGNASSASGSVNVTVDTHAPTVSVTTDPSTLSAGGTAAITFTFSDDPGATFTWNGSAGDVAVSGGTLSAISGTGITRTATFTPAANTESNSAGVSVSAGSFADAAGNTNTAGGSVSLTVDTKAPTVAITSDKSVLKIGDTPAAITFTFSEDPGASFSWDGTSGDVAVSGGTLSAISGSGLTRTATFTPNAGLDGVAASITVANNSYADAVGNLGGAGASPSITVDTVAPSAPSTPTLALVDDSGASNSDGITNDNTLSISGSAADGTTVRLYDGATELGYVTAGSGIYAIGVAGLSEGSHTLTAIAYDAAGNASAASGGLTIVVDHTPPSTTVASAAFSADTGSSATDMVTKEASQTISGTLSANLAAGEQVMVSLDNGATWSPATASVGSNTWELPVTLAGSGTLKVKVVDLAGNGGAVYAHAYTLDTTPPALPSTPDLDAASDSGSSNTDNVTGVTLPSFSGTAEVGSTVRLFDGGNEIGSYVVASDGIWHITTSSSFPMGERIHYITATATDLAGNSSTNSSALEVDVRTGGPTTTIASIALSSDSGTAGDFITNTAGQTVSGTLSANLAAGQRVQVSLNNGASWTDAASAAGQNTWSLPATLTAGSHDIQVRVIDALDNPGTVLTQAYTLDAVKPTVTITSSASTLKADETATITFTFSEDPGASFSAGDLTVSGGTLSPMSGTGTVRTAVFTPTAGTDGGSAGIAVTADSYQDTAGNLGTAGVMPSLSFDTLAPATPSAPDLDHASDSGALDTDNITHETSLVFTGTAEAGATVRLYDSDGTTEIGHATATGGTWTVTMSGLLDGSHTITAKAFDAAGNASAGSGPLTVTVDSAKPAAMAAPAFKTGSDSGTAGDGITNVKKPTFTGSAEAFALVTVYDGAAVLGTASANATGAWEFTPAADLADGVHAISARQTDRAGNQSDAGTALSLTIDTVIPAAPAAPHIAAASDTGAIGDNITENNMPVFEGTALANTLVTLYDIAASGKVKIGSAMSDGSGNWSIPTAGLSYGSHSLSVTQSDAAGNESVHSGSYVLRVDAPPVPVNLIDGVAVDIQPVSLPGGVIGSAVSIPVVTSGRVESSGSAGVADIPLATGSSGGNLLLAQVAPGYGLSASGANLPVANAGELLLAAIKAATPSHGAADQGHLTGNGEAFLDGLAAGGSLLVETVKPVGGSTAGTLTLNGPAAAAGQATALVIDAGGLAAGSTIALQHVNFAAVIGAANVVTSSSMVLSGDAASQHFTVAGGGSGSVFAGGGNDTLSFGATGSQAPAPAAGTTLLHGGSENDVATFSGARADYDLDVHNGYIVVSSHANPAVKATVVNVEQLQFSDASVAVQNSADMGTLAGIYQTVLGRQADMLGIEYWANVHQAGVSWGSIALSIVGSAEQTAGHGGFNGDAAHDITLLYTALFNRTPDAAGLAYWSNALAHGVTLEQVASGFVQSVEMVGYQRAALDWDFTTG